MASSTSGSRTEKPTPRRQQKAREQGQVTRSRDLSASLATMAGLLVVGWQATVFAQAWRGFLGATLAGSGELVAASLVPAAWLVLRSTAAIAGAAWLIALSGSLAQGGFIFAPAALEPKIERLSPAGQLQRLVSVTSLAHLGKSLLPLSLMAYLAVGMVMRDWAQIPSLGRLHPAALTAFVFQHCFELAWKCALVMLGWSGIDYIAERQKLQSSLRMSKQEIREETDWHNVILWQADNLAPFLTKGERVYVEGRLQTRHWEDNEGRKHSATEVVADQVILLGANSQSDGSRHGQTSAPAPGQPRTRTQSAGRGKATQSQPPTDFESRITDDDVPFDQGLRRLS